MKSDKRDQNIWKYFKKGDIVRNEYTWGNRLFVIDSFHGNWYLPEFNVHPLGKEWTCGNACNFPIYFTKLIDSPNRPFKKLKKDVLIKLMNKGNVEAKREFLMRIRRK